MSNPKNATPEEQKPVVAPVAPAPAKPAPEALSPALAPADAATGGDDAKVDLEAPKSNAGRMIGTVHGPMHDVLTGLDYDIAPRELLKDSLWIESQVAAGKMVFVD